MQIQIMKMIIQYIEEIHDENFLTFVIMEKDFNGRDCLHIAVELELLELIQASKIVATIKSIYNSNYD